MLHKISNDVKMKIWGFQQGKYDSYIELVKNFAHSTFIVSLDIWKFKIFTENYYYLVL